MVDQYLKPNVKRGALYDAIAVIVLGVLTAIPLLGCLLAPLTCVIGLLLPFGIGWLVAQWSKTMPTAMTPLSVTSSSPYSTPAVDGAVAAGVGHLLGGIVSLVITLLFGGIFSSIGAAGDPGTAGDVAAGLAIGAAGGVVGLIVSAIIGAIAGAIGGILYVVFSQRQSPAA
jgi:hypothetical protein